MEMTRRYVDMVAMEAVIRQKRLSAMDRLLIGNKASVLRNGVGTAGDFGRVKAGPEEAGYPRQHMSRRGRG